MKLYAPKYYSSFTCIADRCRHSCCIGWEIDIDENTMKRYSELDHPYGTAVRNSIDYSEPPHFRLNPDDRCPHLDGRGLCRIISEIGEDHLCDICREHPRFYNVCARGRFVGLGLSCEEACRIILGSDSYNEFALVGDIPEESEISEFDSFFEIEKIYSILSDRTQSYEHRLKKIASSYSLPSEIGKSYRNDILEQLEYLEEEHKVLFLDAPDAIFPKENNEAYERALAYFVFRHCIPSADEAEFRAALGFAMFCENLLRSLSYENKDIRETARIISEELEYSEDNTESIKTEFMF